ncbi:FkbM family methyltransferase [Komagataeibacter kakiaceti]|uniref:FkbM family methyltransferase n=1 Tax=Komagataeibacter kakiaceti TaxID=943261 RepID=UPI00047155DF|nr:FkbM family methyltransferase [Komagataeibacter kakiaceti]
MAETEFGKSGHVIWGPYEFRAQGNYKAVFRIAAIDLSGCVDDDFVAMADVAINRGQEIVGVKYVTAGELRAGTSHFEVLFSLRQKSLVEYRIGVYGNSRLEMDVYRPVSEASTPVSALLFPTVDQNAPTFLREHVQALRHYYELGFRVAVRDNDVVLSKGGIDFYAREPDDLNLIHEIFVDQVYRFARKGPTVVMDVGMNIGLVSMQFAQNSAVQKVYSYEPFLSTYNRGMANLGLNPKLAEKIIPFNIGLSDVEGNILFNVADTSDSGSRSTRNTDRDGIAMELQMQTAANALRQVRSSHPDCDIIMKIDCEGAEYNILQNLADTNLLSEVKAFMVEWHIIDYDKDQENLITLLKDADFTVIDRSPPAGNGFFYAVR